MRLALLALALLPIAGCNSEPSFDERFESAEQAIRDKALKIDAELQKRNDDAAAVDASAGASPAPEPPQ